MRTTRLVLALLAAGCGSDGIAPNSDLSSSTAGDGGPGADLTMTLRDLGANPLTNRPYTMNLHVPPGYDKSKPTPVLVLLHGYTASGSVQESYFQLTRVSDAKGFLYVYPDGLKDQSANRNGYWNATDACCDLYMTGVDDVAYLGAILDDLQAKFNVDGDRIFFSGHSNGGFMSNRIACDEPRVAAIAELAGAQWKDQSRCKPSHPVSTLHIHGTVDQTILYGGGNILNHDYPGAIETSTDWATKDGCSGKLVAANTMLDLDSSLPGAETKVEAWGGCPTGVGVELWSIQGAGHIPSLNQPTWADSLWAWLSAHPRVK